MTKILYARKEAGIIYALDVDYTLEELFKDNGPDMLMQAIGKIHCLILPDRNRWDEINGWTPPPFRTPIENIEFLNKVSPQRTKRTGIKICPNMIILKYHLLLMI